MKDKGAAVSRASLLFKMLPLFLAIPFMSLSIPSYGGMGPECDFPKNNLTECLPAVQNGIKKMQQTHGEFYFSCHNGFLEHLDVAPNSPLFNETPKHLLETHWELFLSSAPKTPLEFSVEKYDSVEQLYRGYNVSWGKELFRHNGLDIWAEKNGKMQVVGHNFAKLFVSVVDTSRWNFTPTAKLDCKQAIQLAQKYDGGQRPSDKWQYYCSERSAEIWEQSCLGGPTVVWRVRASLSSKQLRFQPNPGPTIFRHFFVDANSGRVCLAAANKKPK